MTIGVCGYGYSGSGAVFDYLRGFEECSWAGNTGEFMLTYFPHGLQDLEYQTCRRATRFMSSDAAIKDFRRFIRKLDTPLSSYRRLTGERFRRLSDEFLNELVQVSWKGGTYEDFYLASSLYKLFRYSAYGRVLNFLEKHAKRRLEILWPERTEIANYPDGFEEKAKKYIQEVLESMGYDLSKRVLLNQCFDVNNPKESMKYFDEPQAVIVDRDPRDIYVQAKKYLYNYAEFIPVKSVEDFITYHRLMRTSSTDYNEKNVLRVQFEDMIYEYCKTKERIKDFLKLGEGTGETKKYFDPARSIGNTQLFLWHPELAEDIRKIEAALPEFLYPFENYSMKPDGRAMPFR